MWRESSLGSIKGKEKNRDFTRMKLRITASLIIRKKDNMENHLIKVFEQFIRLL